MKTVRQKKTTTFEKDLSDGIQQAARDGMDLIKDMINNTDISDATRLAAAKYAIERASEKDKADDQDNSISTIMQFIRQINSAKQLPPPTSDLLLPSKQTDEPMDWNGWLDSNLDKPN